MDILVLRLVKSEKKAVINIAILLARNNLSRLVSNLTLITINKFDKKIMEKEQSQQEKDLLYFFLNEDINDVIKIIKSLEGSGVLIDGVT